MFAPALRQTRMSLEALELFHLSPTLSSKKCVTSCIFRPGDHRKNRKQIIPERTEPEQRHSGFRLIGQTTYSGINPRPLPHSHSYYLFPDRSQYRYSVHHFFRINFFPRRVLYTDRKIICVISYIIIPKITDRQGNTRFNTTELKN